MGGHGRAIEALQDELTATDINKCLPSEFMGNIRKRIEMFYPDLRQVASKLVYVLIAVLMRIRLQPTDLVPHTSWKVEEVILLGLFQHEKDMHLIKCPFVLVWLLATWSQHPALTHFKLAVYDKQSGNPDLPAGLVFWQHWEEFSARFRILKSCLFSGKQMAFSELHSGALLGSKSSTVVEVTQLEQFCRASHQYMTNKEDRENLIKHELGTVTVTKCDSFILNAAGAAAADGFCCLKLADGRIVRELHQNKHIQKEVTKELFLDEYNKAACEGDFFILFSTSKSKVLVDDLPTRTALVSMENFDDYFGPFAGRAFRQILTKICINKST